MPALSRNSDLIGDVRGFGLAADCESPFRILLIVSGGAPLPQGWSWKDLHGFCKLMSLIVRVRDREQGVRRGSGQ